MSQRDQFAREAMNGLVSSTKFDEPISDEHTYFDWVAKTSYAIADAMLKERERTNKSKAQKELEK